MKLTIREVAAIKRNAQNVASYVTKKAKIIEKVKELEAEYKEVCAIIEGIDAGTRAITKGKYMSEDLITKVVESTGKLDANGKEIKVTKYMPKNGILVLDEDGKGYTVIEHEEPVTENVGCVYEEAIEIDSTSENLIDTEFEN